MTNESTSMTVRWWKPLAYYTMLFEQHRGTPAGTKIPEYKAVEDVCAAIERKETLFVVDKGLTHIDPETERRFNEKRSKKLPMWGAVILVGACYGLVYYNLLPQEWLSRLEKAIPIIKSQPIALTALFAPLSAIFYMLRATAIGGTALQKRVYLTAGIDGYEKLAQGYGYKVLPNGNWYLECCE